MLNHLNQDVNPPDADLSVDDSQTYVFVPVCTRAVQTNLQFADEEVRVMMLMRVR